MITLERKNATVKAKNFVGYSSESRKAENIAYMAKIERSLRQLKNGEVIVKSWEELKAMENE